MIRFRTLTAQDRALVQSYTLDSDRRGCDISFANLIGWQFLFNTQIAEVEGYLIHGCGADVDRRFRRSLL